MFWPIIFPLAFWVLVGFLVKQQRYNYAWLLERESINVLLSLIIIAGLIYYLFAAGIHIVAWIITSVFIILDLVALKTILTSSDN